MNMCWYFSKKQQMQQPQDELTTLIGGVYGWKICGRKPSLFAGICLQTICGCGSQTEVGGSEGWEMLIKRLKFDTCKW